MADDISFRDWQHASRLYTVDNFKFGPKSKFLYHVSFYLSQKAQTVVPDVYQNVNVTGMLVKALDLPKYTANTQVLNKYNRKKIVKTNIEYQPVTMTLHDDNYGITRQLLEGYYRYSFADGNHDWDSGAYGNPRNGDNTYKGSSQNGYRFGLDRDSEFDSPYFDKIEISQMAQGYFFMYTLINPTLSEWAHDNLDNSEGAGITQNTITIQYEGVNYNRGRVSEDVPTGFSNASHYDTYGQYDTGTEILRDSSFNDNTGIPNILAPASEQIA